MTLDKKRNIFLVFTLIVILFAGCWLYSCLKNNILFKRQVSQQNQENEQLIISGGVVPHHLVANEIIEKFFQKLSQYQGIENIVILSPDHYRKAEKSNLHFVTATQKEDFKINEITINSLLETNNTIGINEAAVFEDQGITTLLIYLSKYFPQTSLVPVLISPLATQEEVRSLIDEINSILPNHTVIIGVLISAIIYQMFCFVCMISNQLEFS